MSKTINYPFRQKEAKWQKLWEKKGYFKFDPNSKKPKSYILEMLPYPSGNIHMGHLRNYTLGDVMARFKQANGFNVIHPMGFDSFGLPAENAAIEKNIHPLKWTKKNIKTMKEQMKSIGLSYDWDMEISTCDHSYFKHEQKFFLDFLKKGIAYQKETNVNWDPVDKTVLANEQVVDGRGWRSGALIERKKLNGWFLKITDYADELLDELRNLKGWPNAVTSMQKKWLGKSQGANINFEFVDRKDSLKIYTTKPETLYGASFCAISPEHPLAHELLEKNSKLKAFVKKCNELGISEEAIEKAEKLGFDTGLKVKHPFIKGKTLPVFVANFVLMEYGTGAIFACPAHDERDYAFAKKYKLEIKQVIKPVSPEIKYEEPYLEDGIMVNSGFLDGIHSQIAKLDAIKKLEELAIGEIETNFRIRDWGISRQRYWGCPIPIIYCKKCGTVPVPEKDLPVKLPDDVDFSKSGNPLKNNKDWKNCECPECGGKAQRETDTFDTFFESSWYFLRYLDNKNTKQGFTKDLADKFLPVDQYIGGIEHAVMHLLYSRFFVKALRDCGYTKISEPFKKLLTQGMVTNKSFKDKKGDWVEVSEVIEKDGGYLNAKTKEEVSFVRIEKMSKSKKNGVSPVEIIENFGADTARLFMLSDSPPEKDLEWSDQGLEGAWRYINKIWRFVSLFMEKNEEIIESNFHDISHGAGKLLTKINVTIFNVTKDIEKLHLNRAVARIRELSNEIIDFEASLNGEAKKEDLAIIFYALKNYTQLIMPMIPHFALSLWEKIGFKGDLNKATWPIVDNKFLTLNTQTIAVQINGKLRATFEIANDSTKKDHEVKAFELDAVKTKIEGKDVKKVIVVPGKIVNIVVA